MKKILLFIALIAATTVSAQTTGIVSNSTITRTSDRIDSPSKFNILVGADISWMNMNEAYRGGTVTSKPGIGFHIEGVFEQKIAPNTRFYFQTGLGVALRKSGDIASEISHGTDAEAFVQRFSLWYVQIPLAINYKIKFSENFALTPMAGVNLSMGLAGTQKNDYYFRQNGILKDSSESSNKAFDKEEGDIRRFSPEALLGLHAEWQGLIIGVTARIGLTNQLKSDLVKLYESEGEGIPKLNYTGISINVGYRF